MNRTWTVGAVAYDPKVVTIWEGFQAWFATRGFAFDFVLYRHYERQVDGLLRGEHDVSWHSPLAWLETVAKAERQGRRVVPVAMRDTDQDLTSVIVARADGPVGSLGELRGRRLAVGAADSPQATLIPLVQVARAGLVPNRDVTVRTFDLLVGKHGDHVGGEREAVRALLRGEVDAAALIDGNLLAFGRDGTIPAGALKVVYTTPPYDHCVFAALDTVEPETLDAFRTLLLGQQWEDPEVRPLLELEGLRAWRPGRTSGFAQLAEAVETLAIAAPIRAFVAE